MACEFADEDDHVSYKRRIRRQIQEKENELERLYDELEKAQKTREDEQGRWNERIEDINPYSRLEALRKMKVVPDIERITHMTVVIIGLGGVGSVAAEMLTRSGIGKLVLYDCDTVELANMNRLFYRPSQEGKRKSDAAIETLKKINPKTEFEGHFCDVTKIDQFETFMQTLQESGLHGSSEKKLPANLVLSCVDNYAARITVNRACNRIDMPWMESGVSEDAMHGHIQFMVPGRTACYECSPPFAVASGTDESSILKEGVCAASLSTTTGLIAGFLAHNTLKFLLEFGELTYYQNYNSMKNFMSSMTLAPNPSCKDEWCVKRQSKPGHVWYVNRVDRALDKAVAPNPEFDNEWGISIVNKGEADQQSSTQCARNVEERVSQNEDFSLEQLYSNLEDIQSKKS